MQLLPTSGARSTSLWEGPSVEHVETFVNELLAEWCVAALLLRALGGRTSPLRQPLPSRGGLGGWAWRVLTPSRVPHAWGATSCRMA